MTPVLWVAACSSSGRLYVPEHGRPPVTDASDHSAIPPFHSGGAPSHTGTTGASEGSGSAMAHDSGWQVAFVPPPPVAPWATLLGEPDQRLAWRVLNLGDTDADGLDDLGLARHTADTVVIDSGAIVAGDQPAAPLIVATLVSSFPEEMVSRAGDTDHDGFQDLWFGPMLLRGPLRGDYGWDGGVQLLGAECVSIVGGFDADGDGWTDVAVPNARGDLDLHYGPFPTDRPARYSYDPPFDPSSVTTFWGPGAYSTGISRLLGALNEPGQIAITSGWGSLGYGGDDARVFDVRGPRGRTVYPAEAFAQFSPHNEPELVLSPMGDADGDGLDDVLYLNTTVSAPVSGVYDDSAEASRPGIRNYPMNDLSQAYPCGGDLTGDGLSDLVAVWVDADTNGFAVIPGNAPADGPEWSIRDWGVALAVPTPGYLVDEVECVNLDGDGHPDVVIGETLFGGGGAAWIFRGADIAAAYQSGLQIP